MNAAWRLASGGSAIDRARSVTFSFDGIRYQGYAGDTLASALLANGVHLVGRSFKYHRPRGIVSDGVEEPNALVQLGTGARSEPNTRATLVELRDGLVASSQNRWPSLRFDVGAVADALSPLLPAGFYYKTFMWPGTPRGWLKYEHAIRHAAGLGRAAPDADPDRYDHQYAHCDVLVIGGGPAGLAAARAAAARGARVMLCEQLMAVATEGAIDGTTEGAIDGAIEGAVEGAVDRAADRAIGRTSAAAIPGVELLLRTTAFGHYDDNLVAAVERRVEDTRPSTGAPRQRLWLIRAKVIVLASGAIERGIAYANNDLPGTMLAAAVRQYVGKYAVKPGARAVVFTNHDDAYDTAFALHDAGVELAAVVDARDERAIGAGPLARARELRLPLKPASVVAQAHGRLRVAGVDVAPRDGGAAARIDCDLVALSGGYNPAVHLFSQARGTLAFDAHTASFVPDATPFAMLTAGAVNGFCDEAVARAEGDAAGLRAAAQAGFGPAPAAEAMAAEATAVARGTRLAVQPLWHVAPQRRGAKCFVDVQNDVTTRDIGLAAREGYQSVEHLKRYTTLGMGTDQGKTSNVIGLALLGETLGVAIPQVGTTTFRPPYTPVTLGALPGHASGAQVEPTRRTPMHDWHARRGARLQNAGLWKRPHSYPLAGETEDQAAAREARAVRSAVGLVDVSSLGKIELQGSDVGRFLDRIYCNRFDNLAVGKCRYGLMLREDGMVRDDGTTSRLADDHYLMTTTTANAVAIMQHVERLLQVDWPDLDVVAASVTEHWAAAALSGPRAREVLASVADADVSNDALPFLGVLACQVRTAQGAVPARIFRMSYSGELAYEIHVPADRGEAMWEAVLDAGAPFGIVPYGTEAMATLRIEKGHVVIGAEIDGRTTADDLGMGKLVNAAKWCVGKPLVARAALNSADRWQLVGLKAQGNAGLLRGAKLVADPARLAPNPILGHVTSWCDSPHVGAPIALALLARGRVRQGERLWAVSPLAGTRVEVEVAAPCFIDPEGARLRG